jgi:hypothetical protein
MVFKPQLLNPPKGQGIVFTPDSFSIPILFFPQIINIMLEPFFLKVVKMEDDLGKIFSFAQKGLIMIKYEFRINLFLLLFLTCYCSHAWSEKLNLSSFGQSNTFTGSEKNFRNAIPFRNSYDDVSKILAGLPCSPSCPQNIKESYIWNNYSNYIDKNWSGFSSKRLQPVKDWANTELAEVNSKTELLFYPFSGPDCLTAFQFFPKAGKYILIGLEPVGNLPEPEKWRSREMQGYLNNMKMTLSDFFLRGYFISRDMNKRLYGNEVNGVLPLICFFLKRSGYSIQDIKRIEFDDEGNVIEKPYTTVKKNPRRPDGIRITCSPESYSENMKDIYYFSCDISDASLSKNTKCYLYLSRLGNMTVLIKSASYLLHYSSFSFMRNLILNKSQFILQDDTGIPYKYLENINWEVTLYGHYTQPIKVFAGVQQPDLMEAYKKGVNVRKLPFDLGYHWRKNTDSLMLVQRNEAPSK